MGWKVYLNRRGDIYDARKDETGSMNQTPTKIQLYGMPLNPVPRNINPPTNPDPLMPLNVIQKPL